MRVLQLTDPDRIRAFLETDRYWADYALGDLEPDLYKLTEWQGVEDAGKLIALTMLYTGFEPPIWFAMGDEPGIEALLARSIRVPSISLSVRDEHMPIIEKYYRIVTLCPMWKMALDVEAFKPAAGATVQLEMSDVPALQTLYAFGGGDAFQPSEVAAGVFYGIKQAGQLIAVAGTHVVSGHGHIAALGNVMTQPDQRSHGYATIATSAVCAALIDRGITTIGLSVARDNLSAIRVYEKLGFKKHVPFYEGTATQKDSRS